VYLLKGKKFITSEYTNNMFLELEKDIEALGRDN